MADDGEMDVRAVLEKLNAALRLQRRSALEYLNAAAGGKGTAALGVARPLYEFAQAEFEDVHMLVAKIVALGGEPNPEVAEHSFKSDLMDALDQLIEHEGEALRAIHAVIPDTGQEPGLRSARAPRRAHHHAQADAGRLPDQSARVARAAGVASLSPLV